MKFRVEITATAKQDIERNAGWWATHHSLEQAVEWATTIETQLRTLTEFPESYAVSIENEDLSIEVRDKLVGLGSQPSYRAVFTIQDQIVYVLAVRRSSQDRITPDELRAEIDEIN